jgi:glycosyltransferase involved in cell wall biosynthesis
MRGQTSVLICTRNRAHLLHRCLSSLLNQTNMPSEVVVVDNASADSTKKICKEFRNKLSLRYIYEPRVGLPFARNTSISEANGNICAFIDDDCFADSRWIESIQDHFNTYKDSVGVIGFTKNATPKNVYSCVEYVYYLRWVLQNVRDINCASKIQSGGFTDFKNIAFKVSLIKQFQFSTNVPFGDVGDEDVEIGVRIFQKNRNIYFNPSVLVSHSYSLTLRRLITRNFWNGYSQEILQKQMNLKEIKNERVTYSLLKYLLHNTLYFMVLCYSFPFWSFLGKIKAQYDYYFSQQSIPGRL